MLKEIRTLVSSSGSTSATNAAVVVPTRRASALFSQVAENEYRRHSIPYGDAVDNRWACTNVRGRGLHVNSCRHQGLTCRSMHKLPRVSSYTPLGGKGRPSTRRKKESTPGDPLTLFGLGLPLSTRDQRHETLGPEQLSKRKMY